MTTKKTETATTTVTHPTIDGISYEVPSKDADEWKHAGWKTGATKGDETGN